MGISVFLDGLRPTPKGFERTYTVPERRVTLEEMKKALLEEADNVVDEAANEAFKKSLFTMIDFGKLVGWCDEDNVPVPEEAIQSVKGDAQVLIDEDIFDFDMGNDAAFLDSVRKFMDSLREGIEREKEIRKYKAIKAALNGDDGGTDTA